MLIKKTEDFHKAFLYDLADLTIYKHEYMDSLRKFDQEGKLNTIGFGNQPSKNVKFFGSYFTKQFGSDISDIDVILLVKSISEPNLYLRLPQILKNLHNTHFKFIRFYCGYIKGLEPPWKIGDAGSCNFDYTKVKEWIKSIKKEYKEVYEKVKPFLLKDTISMLDIVNADETIKPLISLIWTKEEVIQGYKIYNGVKYDFRETMMNYGRNRVIKLMYEYKNSYCLVDLNIFTRDSSVSIGPKDILSYYTDNRYKKFKYLKKLLNKNVLDEYLQDTRKSIGHITPLASFVDLIEKLKKYNLASKAKIQSLEKEAQTYASRNKIPTIDYDELQKIILEKIEPLYTKYKNFIEDKHKLNMFIIDVRLKQIEDQVPIEEIIERQKEGYECPLFPIDVKHIRFLYFKCRDLLLDPMETFKCLKKACRKNKVNIRKAIKVLDTGEFKIAKNGDSYTLYKSSQIIARDADLKKLQLKALK